MTTDQPTADVHGHEEPHAEMNLWLIGGYLLALTVATSFTLILQRSDYWGPVTNILFVLMISTLKASLVVGFFMHLFYEKAWKFFLMIPPCILGVVLIFALLPDVAFKPWPLDFRPY